MKTIEKGMYVRTEYGIAKIREVEVKNKDAIGEVFELDSCIMIDNMDDYVNYCVRNDIIGEPSFKIIDVIQKEDLIELTSEYCKDEIYRVIGKDDECIALDLFGDGFMCIGKEKDIKRVLTKEQFEMMAYEVKPCEKD